MGGQDFEYKGDKAKTDENHDADGFFTVGDIGYLNEDGFLFLCDRKSDMIIAGGVNIYPAEIEGEMLAHPGVGDVAVFGIPDDDMGEQIKAVVEPAARLRGRRRAGRVDHGAPGRPAGQVQVAEVDRLHRRAAPRAHRQAPQAPAARPLLGGPRPGRSEPRRCSAGGSAEVVAEEVGGGLQLLAHPGEVADAVAPGDQAGEPHVAEHLGDGGLGLRVGVIGEGAEHARAA